ncbi:hypothetical protein CSA37_00235 [Candidatus Fermentibacteria bacterium]|nr:MAG: hypothetical protein CSA37_00235 [Candidatus Fermentibacteria bacterium]
MNGVLLIQLPLHPGTAWEPTGNIPLAPARLAAQANLPKSSILSEEKLNTMGDRALLNELLEQNPELIGATLYLWNRARTIHLLREYKKIHQDVLIVAGGPEVTSDNAVLLKESCVDLFVAGEGEIRASEILNPETVKAILKTGTRFLAPVIDTSPPDRWTDPYETGHLIPEPGGSAHMETQRGCCNLCSYCAYRRTSPVPRITPASTALEKIRHLKELGVEELIFLDPTFNARPDLKELLKGLKEMNLQSFAEVRGDLLREEHGAALRAAGFTSLEVGLQTMNDKVLKSVGRGGNPQSIIRGAGYLEAAGITPVMDLILGLPGDHPESILQAAETFTEKSIAEQVQTFCISVLPGTEIRSKACSLDIEFRDTPPYCITKSGDQTLQSLLKTREEVSDILGYDADPPPRPVFCRNFPGMEIFTPEKPSTAIPPSVRHGVLRITTEDAWAHRVTIMKKIKERRDSDPFCPLDIIIESMREFPLNLLDMIKELPEPECYDREKAVIYNVPSLIRPGVIAPDDSDMEWLMECSSLAVTVTRSCHPIVPSGREIGLLLMGSHDLATLSAQYAEIAHLVFFDLPELERLWNLDVLGLG